MNANISGRYIGIKNIYQSSIMKNIAVILAGGIGSRLNAGIPKQFLKVAGMSVIEHTISAFEHHPQIDEIAVVVNDAYQQKMSSYVVKNGFAKVKKILASGIERYHSSLSAITAYSMEGEECNLIFHDAVRPLISASIISDVIKALDTYKAVDVAVPTADTIIQVDSDNIIEAIPNRKALRRGQTPQGFRLSVIKQAYDIALADPEFVTTDDCGVVMKYLPEVKVGVVAGEESNMKLTYQEDFYLIEKLFQLKTTDFLHYELTDKERAFFSGKVVVVFGASSGIGADLVEVCKECGAQVYGFSRSLTGTDVTSVESVRKALAFVNDAEGRIDCVVDTAAVLHKEPLNAMAYEQIYEAIDINYKGMVIVAKESFEYLKASKGALMFYTSSSYTRGRMNYTIYSSTKCATVNFVQAIAEEWIPYGIRVHCINPERTKTPMRVRNFGIEDESTLLKSIVVATVSAKVLASNVTGQVVDVKIKNFK